MVAKKFTRKKNPKTVKGELLNLLRESDTLKDREFNIHNIIDHREAIDIIKHYEAKKQRNNTRTDTAKV